MHIFLSNLVILSLAGGSAFILWAVYEYIDYSFTKKNNKTYSKGEIYKKKCQKLHDKAFYYYYDLIINNPVQMAYDLASKDLNRIRFNKQVDSLYKKLIKQA